MPLPVNRIEFHKSRAVYKKSRAVYTSFNFSSLQLLLFLYGNNQFNLEKGMRLHTQGQLPRSCKAGKSSPLRHLSLFNKAQ